MPKGKDTSFQLKLNFGMPGWKAALLPQTVADLYRAGYSTYDVGKIFGCTANTVLSCLRDNGVAVRATSEAMRLAYKALGRPYYRHRLLPRAMLDYSADLGPVGLGYLAGLIDGEGSIHIPRHWTRHVVRLNITNSDMGVMCWLLKNLACGRIVTQKRVVERYKPCYHWFVDSIVPVYCILTAVRPYLIVKAAEADRAIRILNEAISRLPRAEKPA